MRSDRVKDGAVFALAAGVLLYGLWDGGLLNSDDAIYADMARSAWEGGGFLDFRWHGAVLFEKPPILFLLVGLSGGLLGFSDLAVRLPGALSGLASVILVAGFARDLGLRRGTGRIAALLLATSYTFVFHSRRVMADPIFLVAMLSFLRLWVRAQALPSEERRRRLRIAALAGVALGLAILSKWLFAVLPLLAALGWHMAALRRPRLRESIAAALCALLVAAPWHLLQSLRHGAEFWKVYAGYHVIERAGRSLVAAPDAAAYPRLLAETDGVLLAALIPAFAALLLVRGPRLRTLAAPWFMAFLVLAPLQLSSTRLPHYLLPVMPLLVLAAAAGWEVLIDRRPLAWMAPTTVALLSLVVAVGPGLLWPDAAIWPGYGLPVHTTPSTRAACAAELRGGPRLLIVNHYDVTATWYCERPVPMLTDDPRFFALQQSVDMMARSGAVQLFSPAELVAKLRASPGAMILTRPGHGPILRDRLGPGVHREVLQTRDADLLPP